MFGKTLETRFTALCAVIVSAFSLSDADAAKLKDGDNQPLTAALESQKTVGDRFAALVTSIKTAFGLDDAGATKLNAGDNSPFTAVAELAKKTGNSLAQLATNLQKLFSLSDEETATVATGDTSLIKTKLDAGNSTLANLRSWLGKALDLKDAEVAALDETKLTAAINKVAGKKAIDIAAGQGTTPVRTEAGENDDDEVAQARTQAAEETDPAKRAQLHAKADRLAAQRDKRSNN